MPFRLLPTVVGVIAAFLVFGATVGGADSVAPHALAAATPHKPRHKLPPRTNLKTSKDLWATINVCDTKRAANTIGVRGSMPGLGNRISRLEMRIRIQFKSKADGKWHNADDSADSGWKKIGHTRRQVIESGQDFTFMAPTDGGSHLLRGAVRFRWKRKGHGVVARRRRVTEAGHASTASADPKGYSAAQCEITAP